MIAKNLEMFKKIFNIIFKMRLRKRLNLKLRSVYCVCKFMMYAFSRERERKDRLSLGPLIPFNIRLK